MKTTRSVIVTIGLFFLCSCSLFYGNQSSPGQRVMAPKPLAVPVSKNWQVVEEPPKLTNERERLPFQTEQSLLPEGAKTAPPVDDRKIDTTR